MNPLRGLMRGNIESYDANFNVSLNRGLMSFNEPVREFSPLQLKPALWLDASDQSTLVTDGAASFTPASNTYLSRLAANSTTLQTGNVDWWWSFWIYATGTGTSGGGRIICKRNNNDADYDIFRDSSNGKISLTLGSGSSIQAFGFDNFVTGSWRHYLIYKSGSTVNYIANGNSGTPQNVTITPAVSSADFAIGNYSANFSNRIFDGYLDSVAFGKPSAGWLASNASALATYLYNSGAGRRSSDFKASSYYLNGNPSGAVSWWDLDERSGTRNDRIGSNDLTDNNSVGYASGIASGLVQYDGDPIKQWSDKSGNARHVTATSDSARPTWKTAVQNGKSIIRFDGVNDVLTVASMINSKENVVMFLVNKYTSGYPGLNNYDSTNSGGLIIYPYSNSLANFESRPLISGSYSTFKRATQALTLANFNILSGVYTTSGMTAIVNGAAGTPESFSSTHCGGYSKLSIGCVTKENANFGAGDFCEVIIFDKALSTSQRQQVERYLANKWGIPVN